MKMNIWKYRLLFTHCEQEFGQLPIYSYFLCCVGIRDEVVKNENLETEPYITPEIKTESESQKTVHPIYITPKTGHIP